MKYEVFYIHNRTLRAVVSPHSQLTRWEAGERAKFGSSEEKYVFSRDISNIRHSLRLAANESVYTRERKCFLKTISCDCARLCVQKWGGRKAKWPSLKRSNFSISQRIFPVRTFHFFFPLSTESWSIWWTVENGEKKWEMKGPSEEAFACHNSQHTAVNSQFNPLPVRSVFALFFTASHTSTTSHCDVLGDEFLLVEGVKNFGKRKQRQQTHRMLCVWENVMEKWWNFLQRWQKREEKSINRRREWCAHDDEVNCVVSGDVGNFTERFFLWILNENWSLLFFFHCSSVYTDGRMFAFNFNGWRTMPLPLRYFFSLISGCYCPWWCGERLHNKKK